MAAVAHAPQQRPFKSYKVLGDEDDFVEQQQAAAQAAAAAEQAAALLARPTVSTASQDDYPADVWAAACRSADGGAAILQAYQDIWAYIHSVGCVGRTTSAHVPCSQWRPPPDVQRGRAILRA